MKNKKILILGLLLISLTSCNSDKQKSFRTGLTKLDDFSITLPHLQEGTKTYFGTGGCADRFKPYEYKTEESYEIIQKILDVSTFYNETPRDGGPGYNILYYFPDNTYIRFFVSFGKVSSFYFDDCYLFCIDGTDIKSTNQGIYCAFKEENLFVAYINYFYKAYQIAGDYVEDPRHK